MTRLRICAARCLAAAVLAVLTLAPPAIAARGALEGATFAHKTFGAIFSKGGAFAGRSVADVAGALRSWRHDGPSWPLVKVKPATPLLSMNSGIAGPA